MILHDCQDNSLSAECEAAVGKLAYTLHKERKAKGLTDKLEGAKPETFGSTNRLQTTSSRPNQEIKLNCLQDIPIVSPKKSQLMWKFAPGIYPGVATRLPF